MAPCACRARRGRGHDGPGSGGLTPGHQRRFLLCNAGRPMHSRRSWKTDRDPFAFMAAHPDQELFMAPLDMSPEDVRLGGEHGGVSARDVELQRERGVLGGGGLRSCPRARGPMLTSTCLRPSGMHAWLHGPGLALRSAARSRSPARTCRTPRFCARMPCPLHAVRGDVPHVLGRRAAAAGAGRPRLPLRIAGLCRRQDQNRGRPASTSAGGAGQ